MKRHLPGVSRRALCLGVLPAAAQLGFPQFSASLTYQNRGRYNEGKRAAPSTGPPVDLIAAQVDYREAGAGLPPQFQAVLFIPPSQDVHLTIREIEPEYYYWLDKAQPESGWQPGKVNTFRWPTQTVIGHLTHLSLNHLGAVAQLGRDDPDANPFVVAPVTLCSSRPPAEVLNYRFVFRPKSRVRLTFTVSAEGKRTPVSTPQDFPELGARETQAVLWTTAGWAEGWYQIAISGYQLSNNASVDRIVRFYHRRVLGS